MRLHHRTDGPVDAPAVLLGPSLGATLHLFDDLAGELADTFRVVRLDHRGHGGSPVPDGPCTVDDLAADVLELADELGLDRFGYLGLSLGGAVGQALALGAGHRLTALVLAATAARFGDPQTWHERAALVRDQGLEPLVGPTTERWFTPEFRAAHPDQVDRVMAEFLATSPAGYAACCEALATYDVSDRLARITVPTLVVAGRQDPTAGPQAAGFLAEGIPAAELVVLDDAAHLVHLARPQAFTAAVRRHLAAHGQA